MKQWRSRWSTLFFHDSRNAPSMIIQSSICAMSTIFWRLAKTLKKFFRGFFMGLYINELVMKAINLNKAAFYILLVSVA